MTVAREVRFARWCFVKGEACESSQMRGAAAEEEELLLVSREACQRATSAFVLRFDSMPTLPGMEKHTQLLMAYCGVLVHVCVWRDSVCV